MTTEVIMENERKAPEKVQAGTYEIWTEGPGFVYIKPFRGLALEIDLSRYAFKTEAEAAALICKMIDSAAVDTLILAGFAPVAKKRRSESE